MEDRYGVSWQLLLGPAGRAATASELGRAEEAAPSDRERQSDPGARGVEIVPALMFPHGQGQATKAAAQYIDLFARAFGASGSAGEQGGASQAEGPGAPVGSGADQMSFHPPEAGQGDRALMQGPIRLAGQRLTLMDSGAPHDVTFGMGVSLTVQCATQEQIDLLWEGLSAVPEAEACGWLKDRFGISWTITPECMTELIARPGAWQIMTTMKKPTLADFR